MVISTSVGCTKMPDNPANGKWVGNFTLVNLVCNYGYQRTSGDDKRTCNAGQWVGHIPVCGKSELSKLFHSFIIFIPY